MNSARFHRSFQVLSGLRRLPLISLALATGLIAGCGTTFNLSTITNPHQAQVAASPTSLSWGKVTVGNAGGPKAVTVTNSGSTDISISSIGFSGANPGDFTIYQNTCGSTLAPSTSCTITVLFKPTTSGTRTATLNFNDSAFGSPQQVALSGLGDGGSSGTGTTTVSISPASLSWAKVTVGNAGGPKVITLSNTGSGTLNISSIGLTGANAGDFSIYKNTCGSTLAASATCTVTVLFKPTASGTRTATLNFTDNAGNSPQQVTLTGLGDGGSTGGTATASVSPASLTWPTITVGQAGTAQTATLTNTGSGDLSISGIGLTGTAASDFAISQNTCGATLAASASCAVTVLFKPTASGTRTATLNFTDNAGNSPQQVTLSGTGEGGPSGGGTNTASVSPDSLTWNKVTVGNAGGPKAATLTNTGSGTLNISDISFTGTNAGDFAIYQNTCGSTLAASATCTVTVLFKPTTSGTLTAMLSFSDDAGNSPQQVLLTGVGEGGPSGSVTVAPASLTFGSVSMGSTSGAQAITLANSTSSAVTLSGAGITGTDASDFAVSSTSCGSSLAASGSCVTNIIFKPTAEGARAATWTITSSSSGTPLAVTLSGSGETSAGPLTVSPSSMDWGDVTFGQTGAAKTATLTNSNSAAVSINSITVTGTNPGDFSVGANTCGSSLAAGSSCTATVYFAPKATGARAATLNFDDAGSNSPQTVQLSGNGTSSTSGEVTTSPTNLTFPQTNTGSTSSALTVTLLNGSANSIDISGIAIQGTNSGDFTQVSTTCGATLAASASCTVNIAFAPTATGTRTAALNFSDSASNSPQAVALSGVGASATVGTATASPTSGVGFGSIVVGQTSTSRTVTLKNNGSTAIAITGKPISGVNAGDFAITTNSCGTSLGAYATCYIYLTFSPGGEGSRTATLTIEDGASNSPQTVSLFGTGIAAPTATITISPSSLTWGSQVVGVDAAPQTFTLTAGGSGSVTFSNIGFTGVNQGDFSITANTCGTGLAQGASCTVAVGFKPSASGNRVALFSVTDDAIGNPQTAEVSGSGTPTSQTPAITIDFDSRSGSQVVIPSNILGTEYLESLPTDANRTTVVQGGFTVARYRLDITRVYSTQTPNWGSVDYDISKLARAGVHPLIELVDTPPFLQPSPSPCPGDPATSVPTDVNQWGQLAATFVAHFDQKFPGLVTNYEIWNEPDTAALCSSDRLNDYLRIYAAAAPQLKAQASADGVTIRVGGPAAAGPAFPTLMTDSTTAPYVDFYSYHFYEGNSTDITNGMTWDGAGGTPSLLGKVLDPKHGVQALYLQAYNQVKAGKTPLGANTPIYFDEYNDDWAFRADCCRNSPIYSPLFNSITVAQLLNSVYKGAGEVPSMLIYYSAAQQTFCILGVIDTAMDCTKATTGDQAQPYPQWYTYEMMFAPAFLDLQDGGHMAASVTLSSSASSSGIITTGWYTGTKEAVLVINPTATSYSGITLQVNNPGITSPNSTLYTINADNPHISQWPASTVSVPGGIQTTFDLPPYSVIALSLK